MGHQSKYQTEVYSLTIVELVHGWPGVVNFAEQLPDVQYLAYPHRHRFFFKAYVGNLAHTDRAVEFINLSHKIEQFIHARFPADESGVRFIGPMSCEMLGELILDHFDYVTAVDVSEDNENGSIVRR